MIMDMVMEHTPARAERAVQSTCHGLLCRTSMLFTLGVDALYFSFLCLRPSPALAAENLFLRKAAHAVPRAQREATMLAYADMNR